MRLLTVGVLFTFVLTATASADPITLESYMVRDWNIGAYGDENTREFTHCAMHAEYKNGVLLVFGINAQKEWYMNLANNNWKLTEGDKFNFDIAFDGKTEKNWFGEALSPTLLNVPLANDQSLFELFSASQKLTIRAQSRTFGFDLSNSRVALEAVVDCTSRYLAASPVPFARAPKGTPPRRG